MSSRDVFLDCCYVFFVHCKCAKLYMWHYKFMTDTLIWTLILFTQDAAFVGSLKQEQGKGWIPNMSLQIWTSSGHCLALHSGCLDLAGYWNFPKSRFFFFFLLGQLFYSSGRNVIHPFSIDAFPAVTLVGSTEPVPAVFGQRKATTWTSCQFNAGPTQTQQSTFTPTDDVL